MAARPKILADAFEEFLLAGAFSHAAFERLAGVGLGVEHDGALLATDGDGESDAALGLEGKGFGEKVLLEDGVAEEDAGRRGLVVVELGEEGGQDGVGVGVAGMGGEVGAVAVIVAAADEEDLDAGLAADLVGGDDVGRRRGWPG